MAVTPRPVPVESRIVLVAGISFSSLSFRIAEAIWYSAGLDASFWRMGMMMGV